MHTRPVWVVDLASGGTYLPGAKTLDTKYVRAATADGAIATAIEYTTIPRPRAKRVRLATPADLGCVPVSLPAITSKGPQ